MVATGSGRVSPAAAGVSSGGEPWGVSLGPPDEVGWIELFAGDEAVGGGPLVVVDGDGRGVAVVVAQAIRRPITANSASRAASPRLRVRMVNSLSAWARPPSAEYRWTDRAIQQARYAAR